MNTMLLQVPKLNEFFEVIDTVPAVRDVPSAKELDEGRWAGLLRERQLFL